MTSGAIAKATATRNQTGSWVVDYTMTTRGSALWDKVAEENFHQLLSVDFDGRVVSVPIIQPTQSSFSSFDGRGEISGNLTRAEAVALARALRPA
jgi:preprotein translocase subunit SecD